MREIPVEVAALIKSRSMIGDNKPSCEVTVEGLGGVYNWQESNIAYNPHTSNLDYHPSCVKLADGRILYMYSRGTEPGSIYQSYIIDVDTFISQNDSVTSESVVLNNLYYPRATIFFAPDGGLYFIAAYTKTTTNTNAKIEVYKSASGDGSDWVLYSTINTTAQGNGPVLPSTYLPVGIPYFIGSRWILSHIYFYNPYATLSSGVAISTSDDNGLTWTMRTSHINGPGGGYMDFCSRNIGFIDGELWWSFMGQYSGYSLTFLKSTDNGTSWITAFTLASGDRPTFITDRFDLYASLSSDGGGINVYKTASSPLAWTDFVDTLIDLPFRIESNKNSSLIGVTIDNKLLLMCDTLGNQSNIGVNVLSIESKNINIPIKSISISRNKNMAGSLSLSIDNKNGEWSPDNTVHQNSLFTNKEITVKQGYGTNLISTFKGLIDRIEMSTFPAELKLSIRDMMKKALDQTITWTDGVTHVILFQSQTVEAIFTALCGYAGLTVGTIEATGLTITKTFSWETYADCFSFLSDLVGFEYGADENGLIYFRKDTMPTIPTISYEFKEGEDIISLGYTIDDNDLYSKVVVYGKDANDNVIFAQKEYVSKDYYNVLPQKFMKIDVSEASTVEQLQAIADRAEMLMRSRVREVNFAAIAVPWLQVGDIIRVTENSTTISELYRITDLSTTQDANGYTMQITCYHHNA